MNAQAREKHKGKPTVNGGRFAGHSRTDADITLVQGWVDRLVEDGGWAEHRAGGADTSAETKYFEAEGYHVRTLKFEEELDGSGSPRVSADAFYQDGKLHNPGGGVPALRTWENGKPKVTAWLVNGKQQDPEPGVPALQILDTEGQPQIHIHYQAGKVQDPAPGVAAHVATLDGGRMKRSTFYTQDQVAKQVDEIQLPMPGHSGPVTAIVTREREE